MSNLGSKFAARRLAFGFIGVAGFLCFSGTAVSQHTANSLAELRSFATSVNNATVTLSATGGDPHPVTGIVTPGHYWINGDHIADPTNTHPRFLTLGGTGNTYNFSGVTINLDTRKLDGYGRALGHSSGVDVVRIEGSNNLVQDLTLIGQDIALDTDPNAQRYADWATQYVELSGDSNTVDGAHVVARGSRTDTYGLSDAFGKGASQGIQPFIGHRKASNFRVGEATNAVVNDVHLETYSFGHNFFVQSSTDTTLTNSTIKAELFPSQLVIDRSEYQEYGHTWWGEPIPDDIMLAGSEGGVRVYGGSSGLTVDNVIVDGARTGFATVHDGGDVNISNSFAFNTTSGFDVGDNTTITNSGGNIVNGPLLVFYGSGNNVDIDLELTEGTPIGTNWSAAYFNGNADISITSDLEADDLPEESYIRLGQSYFENWRGHDFNTATPEDGNPTAFNNRTFVNDTYQMLVIGENAEGNVGSSRGAVISNGKENYYDGVTLVEAGPRLRVVHNKGLGNSGTETGAEFDADGDVIYTGVATEQTYDDNGTIVENGATLELGPGVQISNEKLTITGDGIDGLGALYSKSSDNRFGSSSSNNQAFIVLDGSASVGVEDADDQLIVGQIQGVGDLTKKGLGRLALEKSNTFDGDLIIEAGSVSVRSGGVNHGLDVQAGASISQIGSNGYNTVGDVTVDGSLDLNGRSDDSSLAATIGRLHGRGVILKSNPNAGTQNALQLVGDAGVSDFAGEITGAVSLEKTGNATQILSGALTHTGTTTVNGGALLIDGTHAGGGLYSINDGTLGGSGSINVDVKLFENGTLDPGQVGAGAGTLTLGDDLDFNAGTTAAFDLHSASEHDQLIVADDTRIYGGTLALNVHDASQFSVGDTLTLIESSGGFFGGEFDAVTVTGGLGVSVLYEATQLKIVVDAIGLALAGDYNGDGFVSQADLDMVLLNWGESTLPAGVNLAALPGGAFDGQISQNEIDTVLLNWGAGSPPSVNAIPEPTTAGVLAIAGATLLRRRGYAD